VLIGSSSVKTRDAGRGIGRVAVARIDLSVKRIVPFCESGH